MFRKLLLACTLLVMASCAQSEPPAVGDGGGPDDLVARVSAAGGFLPGDVALGQIPGFSLFGDGSVVTVGPQIAIYPGPALPNLQRRTITEAGIRKILEAARDAGLLGEDRTLRNPGVADAPTTTFTVVADGKRHVVKVEAMGIEPGPGMVSDDELKQRKAIEKFNDNLSNLKQWLGADAGEDEKTFEFDELRIFVRPATPPSDQSIKPQTKDWPLPDAPLAEFGDETEGTRCGTLDGGDLDTARPHFETSNQITQWRSEGKLYQLVFRPLLPDESGC